MAMVRSRREALAASLVPGDRKAIAKHVTLLRTMPSQAGDEEAAQADLVVKVEVLKAYPEWAVAETCQRFLSGKATKQTRYCPSSADLAPECGLVVAPVHEEIAKLDRILTANVYHEPTAEERERVSRRFDELLDVLGKGNDPDGAGKVRRRREREFRASEQAKALKALDGLPKGLDVPSVSGELAAKIAATADQHRADMAMRAEREARRGRAA